MVKRFLALALALVLFAMTLAACAAAPTTAVLPSVSQPEEGEEVTPLSDASYTDDLDGLCAYLEANGAVIKGEGEAAFTEMSYKEIGAIGGYRYRFTCGKSTVQAEFYEFDLDNLDAKGKECVGMVGEKGFFTVLGNDVRAQLHPNRKYMMIYNDTGSAEINEWERAWVAQCFSTFKAG